MTEIKFVLTWILITVYIVRETYCQCGEAKLVVDPEDGTIQSPNFPRELGKAANCTWEFTSSKDKEYMLVLTFVNLRMYYVVEGSKQCSAGNVLKMNNELVDCEMYVHPSLNATFCNAYYSSSTCNTTNSGCKKNKQTSFPVQVTYESDGKVLYNYTGPVDGFKVEHKYTECPSEPDTTTTNTITTTVPFIYSTDIQTSDGSTTKANTMREDTSQDTNSILNQQEMIILSAACGGGLILVCIATICICCRDNRKRKLPLADEEFPPPPPVEDTYVPMSPISMKPEENPEIDQHPQDSNMNPTVKLEDVSNYATIAELENSTSQANQRQEHFNIAVVHPVEANKKEDVDNVLGEKSIDQADVELYSTIKQEMGIAEHENSKNSANQSNQGKANMSLAPAKSAKGDEKEDMYVAIKNQTDRSDDLYSSIETERGTKSSIYYNKTVVGNVLYVPAEEDNLNMVEESVYDLANDQ